MHLLLIGSGGREHAMAWKLSQSDLVTRVSVAPGNPGMAAENKVSCIDIDVNDIDSLLRFASDEDVHLSIVGPEAPLVAGIVDKFQSNNLRIFGPGKAAARLEGSKSFAKDFMARNNIPTAAYATFNAAAPAHDWVEEQGAPIVIKADGLAAGKGVVVAQNIPEATAAIDAVFDGQFGAAGSRLVVEEFLPGEEASFIAVVAGRQCIALASSQDHKARDEGDTGPNTGGMGAYSPAPVVTPAIHEQVMQNIIQPTINALADEGMPFTGFLYAGLMIDADTQARVVEFNVRLGDPETQPLMMRLQSDLLELLDHAVDGTLADAQVNWLEGSAMGVVLAAGEYPQAGSRGEPVSGIESAESKGAKIFHAGTRVVDGQLVTNGGRVLCATATGETLERAKAIADEAAACIKWKDVRYRKDIGFKALKK